MNRERERAKGDEEYIAGGCMDREESEVIGKRVEIGNGKKYLTQLVIAF